MVRPAGMATPFVARRGEAEVEDPPEQTATAVQLCSLAPHPAQQPVQAAVTDRSHRPSRLRRREWEVERVRLMRMRRGARGRWRLVRGTLAGVQGAVVAPDRFPWQNKRDRVIGRVQQVMTENYWSSTASGFQWFASSASSSSCKPFNQSCRPSEAQGARRLTSLTRSTASGEMRTCVSSRSAMMKRCRPAFSSSWRRICLTAGSLESEV